MKFDQWVLADMRDSNRVMRRKIMLATPMLGGAQPEFMRSREAAVSALNELGFAVALNYVLGDSLLTHARNAAAQQFLDSGFDYLMFIDSDMGFGPLAIPRLLHAGKDIVCGAAPQKTINWEAVRAAALRGEANLEDFAGRFIINTADGKATFSEHDPLIEVTSAGTGFMLVRREVFEALRAGAKKMTEHDGSVLYDFFTEGADDEGRYLSEDFHFCHKWRRLGGRVYVDPYVRLTHTGPYTFRGDITRGTT